MKKKIVLSILLSLCIVFSVICFSLTVGRISQYLDFAKNPFGFPDIEKEYTSLAIKTILVDCLLVLIFIFDAICLLLLFIPPSKSMQERKKLRSISRAKKAEADKQKRIAELQVELDELKNRQ